MADDPKELRPFKPAADGKYKVYPVGLKHFRKFTSTMSSVLLTVARQSGISLKDIENGKLTPDKLGGLVPLLLPIVISDMMDIVLDCCNPKPKEEDIIHWEVPQLAMAWLEVSFLDDPEKKLRPWVQAVETLIQRLVGKPFSIWDSLSKLSLPAATPDGTSSSTGNQSGPTKDGPSPSSGTGQSEQSNTSMSGT